MKPHHTLLTFCFCVAALAAVGCNGGVQHPEPGQPNSEEYCKNRDPMENNCMACASLPGCGWCDQPASGKASCQPGNSSTRPGSCTAGWAFGTEECTAPPPPPPESALATSSQAEPAN
ncbi:MAG TPA: hypothetical protein VLC09_21460 [Polyangiaceae bacterium]|nr:hypothetical protein [Polyangiaceae bacterium]